MRNVKNIIAAVLCVVSLAACQNVKKELGVGRNSPDEFTVVKRAPLTLPPDYELRAPAEGTLAPPSAAVEQARSALMGETTGELSGKSGDADDVLLQKMGATGADPNIRSVIAEENGYLALENKTVADKLLNWGETPPTDAKVPASIVNAAEEKKRIEQNAAEGKPVNEGDVPVIEKKKGTIDKIF
jgi:hypothetical protein